MVDCIKIELPYRKPSLLSHGELPGIQGKFPYINQSSKIKYSVLSVNWLCGREGENGLPTESYFHTDYTLLKVNKK